MIIDFGGHLKKKEKFSSVSNPKELIRYLESRNRDKDFVFHYTTIHNLNKIYKTKSFRLSSLTKLNDLNESIDNLEFSKYLGSFSRESNESIAMWGMYSIPWELGIRIAFPKKQFRNWIDKTDHVYFVENQNQNKEIILSKNQKKIYTVCYVNENNTRFDWSNTQLYLKNKPDLMDWRNNGELLGYVKEGAWKYESELRVVITLDKDIKPDYVFIPMDNDILNSMIITLGPKFSNKNDLFTDTYHLDIRKSKYTDIVVPKTVCESCKHNYECCKNE